MNISDYSLDLLKLNTTSEYLSKLQHDLYPLVDMSLEVLSVSVSEALKKFEASILNIDHTNKSFFKLITDMNFKYYNKLNYFLVNIEKVYTEEAKSNIGEITLTLPDYDKCNMILTNLDMWFNNISVIYNNTSLHYDFDRFYSAQLAVESCKYFNMTIAKSNGYINVFTDKNNKPIIFTTTKKLGCGEPSSGNLKHSPDGWGWSSEDNLTKLTEITSKFTKILNDSLVLLKNSTIISMQCSNLIKESYTLANSNSNEVEIFQQKMLQFINNVNCLINVNKIYQSYVIQLSNIMLTAWTNIYNFCSEINKRK